MGNDILILVGDFGEDYEIMVSRHWRWSATTSMRSVQRRGETVETAIHDFRGDQTYLETGGHNFELTATMADVDPVAVADD